MCVPPSLSLNSLMYMYSCTHDDNFAFNGSGDSVITCMAGSGESGTAVS